MPPGELPTGPNGPNVRAPARWNLLALAAWFVPCGSTGRDLWVIETHWIYSGFSALGVTQAPLCFLSQLKVPNAGSPQLVVWDW